ncbi:MAG TPA: cation:proton antiporter [Candidatus Thermoplasmatota archaeon]|nr:cation:proton antiporter [Candidatus Thermoplasmatota archaeon]
MAVNVALDITILLSVAFVAYIIATLTRQSVIIGEILVGLVVGPSLLGWISVGEFVEGIALVGAIVLLFLAGLGHRFGDIFRGRYALIALAGVVVPWVGGFLFAEYSGYDRISALFIGTALTATSIAITVNVLTELGRINTDAGRAILGAAVIDDVLGLIALAITIQSAQGGVQLAEVALIGAKAVVFILAGAIIGSRLLQPGLERLDRSKLVERHPELLFLVAINIAFLYSAVAEAIGLSAIVGAFLAGVSLDATRHMHGRSFKDGTEYLTTIFASIFFVSLGVLVDLRGLSVAVVPFMLGLTAIALATKFIGCAIPARLLGMSWRDTALVGAGMAPRGEVALIVALLALNANAIGQEVYTSVVVMSLLTTLVTPPALKWIARERTSRRAWPRSRAA